MAERARKVGGTIGGGRQRWETKAIGHSRGGRTTKSHALTDKHRRPLAFLIIGGNVGDCMVDATPLDCLPDCAVLNADKGHHADGLRKKVQDRGALANIPTRSNRK
jgi:hypothetical protein